MRKSLVSAIALALAVSAGSTLAMPAQPAAAESSLTPTQLPRNVRPVHYAVAITPHADKLNFDGQVTVDVQVLKPSTSITLNAEGMTFSSVTLEPAAGKGAAMTAKVAVDEKKQTATFSFDKPVAPGSYKLAMNYVGTIGTQANGLFAIDYPTTAGQKRALFTQFENSDARRFIPSWDEPAYKASFDLSVTVPGSDMAVSNMPVASKADAGNGLEKVTFQTTPKMSTYLLFFGLGEFDRVTTTSDGTEIGVVMQKGKGAQAAFTLDSAKAVLHDYNDYFGIKYPLPKLDNIAAPGSSQFFSAMENWGAIFTFEYAMLLDPSFSTQGDKMEVFNTAAHEMAHQWFGDLVTMNWWDNLWLNEGFASWMAERETEKVHPEWNTVLDTVGTREGAMSVDAVATTHPIVQKIDTVEQASQAFDTITYSKGEAVIRMLEAYVGPENWRRGVHDYLKAHAYGNTVSDDLWHAVDGAAPGKRITQVAHDFTLQPGVPLIKVDSTLCSNGETTIKLTQGEFTKDRPNKQPLRWHVPVIAQVVGNASASTLVDGSATLKLQGCGPVLVNAGQSGYYRTLYAPAQLAALKQDFDKLAPIDQLGLMSDTWAESMAGLEPVSDFLDMAKATPANADPEIWAEVAGSLVGLDQYYRGDQARQDRFRAYAVAQLKPVFARVGWDAKPDESTSTTLLRTQLIGALSALGDQDMLKEVRRRFDAQATDPKAVPAALRKTIFAIVAQHADAATWDKLHAQAKAEKSPMIKDRLYGLLSVAEDKALAQRALDLALTDEPGATNSAGMIGGVAWRHPEMAYDFAMAHRAQVDKLVDTTSSSRYYPALGGSSFDPAMIGKIKAYEATIDPSARRPSDSVIANIQYRMMIRKDRLPAVDAWLAKNGG
ncbi:M1 family metallopeptidase [Rhodanobacter sp. DHG33]|uniref:M1 family metallopeptidase n=1 Tax=Rhodanobacter sp. DHG33 TaxID=2775921 RepID=UPI00178640CD|nr:M1 family metallopeptidase [Rhodanobacter sp. DHG33]MBD8900328.1 M1 family metallopeptidase [Rhodanobacter sp. DHG33]